MLLGEEGIEVEDDVGDDGEGGVVGRVFGGAGHFFGGFEVGLVGGEVFLVEVGEDVDLFRGAGAEEGAEGMRKETATRRSPSIGWR